MNSRHLHRIVEIDNDQGRIGDDSLRASRAALGLNPDTRDILETPASRWLAALLLVIVILAALEQRFARIRRQLKEAAKAPPPNVKQLKKKETK